MKVLVLGGEGMAGHIIYHYLKQLGKYQVSATRRMHRTGGDAEMFTLDVREMEQVEKVIQRAQPDVLVNAVGLLNEQAAEHLTDALLVNAWLPHLLSRFGQVYSSRLIHLSTDCVFSGKRGGYTEQDIPDGLSAYALTKKMGEVKMPPHLNIRTSIIGPELKAGGIGLLHWFLQQVEMGGTVEGYAHVFWNGVTTLELAKCIGWCIEHPICGVVHLGVPEKISKYDLLKLFQCFFDPYQRLTILRSEAFQSDKSLRSERADFCYPIPSYWQMMCELKAWMSGHQTIYKYAALQE